MASNVKTAVMSSKSLASKMLTCFIAGLIVAALILLLGNSGTISWFPSVICFFSCWSVAFDSFSTTFYLALYRRYKGENNSLKIEGFLYALIRYCIAFSLAVFGWKKILGLQFVVPVDIASRPMNEQSGEWLTWYYFGYSHTFGFILAAIQILGSYLLLFRRTMLLAEVVLFSFMLNLTLINIFYDMNAGALLQSVVLTVGLLFLMLSEYKRLSEFFLKAKSLLPTIHIKSPTLKSVARLSAIILSLLFTIYLKLSSQK